MELSERLRELRKKAGYSQETLAEMLDVSRQAVSKWESSQGKPDVDNVIKLTEIYQVSADYILLGKENTPAVPAAKKELHPDTRKTLNIIAIIGATALITVLFIALLCIISFFTL